MFFLKTPRLELTEVGKVLELIVSSEDLSQLRPVFELSNTSNAVILRLGNSFATCIV
jgi:hypothetical protein